MAAVLDIQQKVVSNFANEMGLGIRFPNSGNWFYFKAAFSFDLFWSLIICHYTIPKVQQNQNNEILGSSQGVQKPQNFLDHHGALPHIY